MNGAGNLISLTCDCRERFPKMSALSGPQQRRLVRLVRYCVIDQVKAGEKDATIIRDACLNKVQQQKEFGSLVALLTIAVLTSIVEYVVRKLLERWFTHEQL